MENKNDTQLEVPEEEPSFEMSAEEATGMGGGPKPGMFNRKKVLIFICVFFAVIVGGGLIFNTLKPKKKSSASETELTASGTSTAFLSSLRDQAVNRREQEQPGDIQQPQETEIETLPEPLLPPVSFAGSQAEERRPATYVPPAPPPSQTAPPAPQQGGGVQPQPQPTYYRSSLVAPVQGSLFSSGAPVQAQQAVSSAPQNQSSYNDYYSTAPSGTSANRLQASEYALQNNQENKQSFYDPSGSGGIAYNGRYLGENSIWAGTVIPGILVTAINTDLPGNVLARVTQNIYDSQTGRSLLIPQGSVVIARYNSSVSYSQNRVQIVWDTLIRPDGFQLDFEGANGIDRAGMSGQEAVYHENWFEYLKAAGIITLFSLANAKMTETAAQYSSDAAASNIASANSDMVNELGGNIISRALNIQPTLTVNNGTLINIMLDKTLYLPPVNGYRPAQKYVLE